MRLIDADALMEHFAGLQKVKPDKNGREYSCNFRSSGGEQAAEWYTIEDAVEIAPTIDAVPVVRCSECKHFVKNTWECLRLCDRFGDEYADARVYPDWFCADGERKDGERDV